MPTQVASIGCQVDERLMERSMTQTTL